MSYIRMEKETGKKTTIIPAALEQHEATLWAQSLMGSARLPMRVMGRREMPGGCHFDAVAHRSVCFLPTTCTFFATHTLSAFLVLYNRQRAPLHSD
jgi:hypothetical protein